MIGIKRFRHIVSKLMYLILQGDIAKSGVDAYPLRRFGFADRPCFCEILFDDITGGDITTLRHELTHKSTAHPCTTACNHCNLATEILHFTLLAGTKRALSALLDSLPSAVNRIT